jgi:hypothetical protein
MNSQLYVLEKSDEARICCHCDTSTAGHCANKCWSGPVCQAAAGPDLLSGLYVELFDPGGIVQAGLPSNVQHPMPQRVRQPGADLQPVVPDQITLVNKSRSPTNLKASTDASLTW